MTDDFTPYDPTTLPAPIVAYLDARDANAYADAEAVFTRDAVVTDDGRTYEGIEAITEWIETSSTEFTYTSTRIGQRTSGDEYVVQVRLDGTFPGGTVVLRYRFAVEGGLIGRLTIAV